MFIPNSDNLNDFKVREKYGKLTAMVGIACNVVLCFFKIFVGIVFKSVSILADGVNNLSDAANSIITLIGFKLASKPADKDHPFGHARYEYLSGLLVSFLILMLGLTLVKSSVIKIFKPDELYFSMLSVVVLCGSILVKLWMFLFNRKIGKKISSIAVIATSQDSLNDVFATSGVLLALLIARFTGISLDGYMGLLVSLFVIYSGISLINDTLSPLLGEAPKEELVCMIENEIKRYDGVIGIHDLVVHNYGHNKCFATVHCEVPASQNILVSHDIIDDIENDFLNNYSIHLVIHLDPIETDNLLVISLKELVNNIIKKIDLKLSIHDFRVAIGQSHNNLIFDLVVPFEFKISDCELKNIICKEIKKDNPKNFAVIQIDKKYVG
jgi:cation diffusion facilitator family transporter